MKSRCTSSNYGENLCKVSRRLVKKIVWGVVLTRYPLFIYWGWKMTKFTMWKKSEVKKMTKLKWKKVTKINLKIISKPRALLQTWEKTCAKFQKDWFKIVWEVAITWYPLSIHLRSVYDKVQKEQKSDKKYGKDYIKSICTSSDYGENMCKVPKRLV